VTLTTLAPPAKETTSGSTAAPRSGGRGGRIAVIDGLRLLAAVAVAFYHFSGSERVGEAWGGATAHLFPTLGRFSAYGFLGVELFFMISGFVICMSAWGRPLGDFARSRITRLFPAYWPAVLITTAVVALWPVATTRLPADQVILNLTMLNNPLNVPNVDDVYWTLWQEARFYLLFGVVLVWRGLSLRRALIFGYGWLIAGVFTIRGGVPILGTILQPAFAPLFVAGMAFYLIHRFGGDLKLWGLVGLSYALSLHNVSGRIDDDARTNHYHLSHVPGFGLITAFFLIMGVIAMGWTARVRWRWLTTAGLLTYPFYLLHQSVGWALIHGLRDLRPRKLTLVLVILIMLVAAWLLHRLVEKPLARVLKRKLAESSAHLRTHAAGARPRRAAAQSAPAQSAPAQSAPESPS
jgi:peptidoglycan/LPS O-acetylase OafA/YrhL